MVIIGIYKSTNSPSGFGRGRLWTLRAALARDRAFGSQVSVPGVYHIMLGRVPPNSSNTAKHEFFFSSQTFATVAASENKRAQIWKMAGR